MMAAGRFDKPGTKFGPCIDDSCNHRDCNLTREMVSQVCKYCKKEIGYDTRFYVLPFERDHTRGELVHALCHEDAIEEESKLDPDYLQVIHSADQAESEAVG